MTQCPFNSDITTCGMILGGVFRCEACGTWKEYIDKQLSKLRQGSAYVPTINFSNNGDMTTVSVPIRKESLVSTTPPDQINEFDTGAIRSSDENKTLWDLIPVECLERVAIKYTDGAKIYGKHNWKKGIPTERYVGGALRHFMQWRLGQRDEDHLAACVFNLFGIMFNEFTEKEYPYKKEK